MPDLPVGGLSPIASLSSPLSGQQALVTGGNSGIGDAIALQLAAAGADIAINYINDDEAACGLAQQIESLGRRAIVLKGDVSKEEDVASMFQSAIGHFGTLNILINNAGVQAGAPLVEMTLAQWDLALHTNLTGQFLCMREAVREFLRRGIVETVSKAAGKIVCISSVHQEMAWSGHVNYAASKGGVMMLMRSAALELAPARIRINAIAPGAIRTAINRSAWETPQAEEALKAKIPYGRIGETADIAQAATWLVSDAADYMTGATLTIDGGLSLTPNLRTMD